MALRILITRPSGQSDGLSEALVADGFLVERVPVLVIEPIVDEPLRRPAINAVLALDNYQHVIFISTNAVHYGMALVDQYWPQWPLAIHWHAIGRATAGALAEFDIETDGVAAVSNSEALLANASLRQLEGQKVLIFRGQGGREHLAQQLRERGAQVDYAELYQRRCAEESAAPLQQLLAQESLAAVVVLSGDSLASLQLLAADRSSLLLSLVLVVPGVRVAGLAVAAGFRRVVVAENAGAAAVVKALRQEL